MRRRFATLLATTAAAVAAAALLFLVDPVRAAWYPKCPFRWMTGLDCPGCGTGRALHALAHLRFVDFVRYNPALLLGIPYLLWLLADPVHAEHPVVIRTMLVLVVVWWVVRNLPPVSRLLLT